VLFTKTNEDILSELKINPVVKKIQKYRSKWIQHVWQMDRNRQTATLNYEISTMWEMKPGTTPQKTSGVLLGPEQVTRHKTLQAILSSSSSSSYVFLLRKRLQNACKQHLCFSD
jgi:hypothetical protein